MSFIPGMSLSVTNDDLVRVYQRAESADNLGAKIAKAIELIEGVLDDLGEEAIAISFNGGKDCTILLHLFAAVLYARHAQLGISPRTSSSTYGLQIGSDSRPNGHASHSTKVSAPINGPSQPPPPLPSPSFTSPSSTQPVPECISNQAGPSTPTHHHAQLPTSFPYPPIKSIYITAPNPFPTLESFVLSSADRYGLDLYRFGGGMKAALSEYLGCGGGRGVRGVLVGTRRGDPNGDVEPLAPTDPSWPAFLRVHPILDWSYADVWTFLRELDVRWCSLYDEGYTSLGSTKNTVPNPLLRNPSGGWQPAWKLEDASQERAGRLDASS